MGGYGSYGQYDDISDDDYASYSDVYASMSPSSTSSSSASASSTAQVAAGSSNQPTLTKARPMKPVTTTTLDSNDQPGWSSQQDGGFEPGPPQWYLDQQRQGISSPFDLVVGSAGGGDQASGSSSLAPGSDSSNRASERNTLAPGQLSSMNNHPTVPTSTTTPSPEFVMLNPTTTNIRTGSSS